MTFQKAQQEFKIRYYHWAISEFEREIDGSFPDLVLFRTGPVWQLYQFMQELDIARQLALARSLLRRFHPEAVKALGETCSVEEESLRYRLDGFRHDATSKMELEMDSRRRAGERIRFISKRKLLNTTSRRFQEAFGSECVESDRGLTGDPSLEFQTKFPGGWIISTHFWFGRSESLIDYGHTISSEITFEHHGSQGPYLARHVIAAMVSFCDWLGICSQTQWEYLTDDKEVDHACSTAIKFSERFFEVAPKLLNGLEVDKIAYP
jgi:hypothetical protein